MKRNGDATAVDRTLSTEERFWAKVIKDRFLNPERPELGQCWLFTGAKIRGYGAFWDGTHNISAHRYSYRLAHGSIPEDLTLDHLCYTRNCVRPDHLEPVTTSENSLRAHGRAHYIVLT